jgi:hypothetical protein
MIYYPSQRPRHLTEEEVYEIFRTIFANEDDALAATIRLFQDDSIGREDDYEVH